MEDNIIVYFGGSVYTKLIKLIVNIIPFRKSRKRLLFYLMGGKNIYSEQNRLLLKHNLNAESLIVFLLPEMGWVGGGVLSIFSIAKNSRKFRNIHNSDVIMMTRPVPFGETYPKQTNFKNSEEIFRFTQIVGFKNLKSLIVHIPEIYISSFYMNLSPNVRRFLKGIPNLHINVVNQNNTIMPNKDEYQNLYSLTKQVTQTVGYDRDATQEYAERQGLPTLLLPSYLDLSEYSPLTYEGKEKIIIYSNDEQDLKIDIIDKVKKYLPEYRLVEINNMTFDTFINLATRCRYTISFGASLDYYFIHTITQGGLTFTVYRSILFPSDEYKNFDTVFMSSDDMLNGIVDKINAFDQEPEKYTALNKKIKEVLATTYNEDIYLKKIQKFYENKFDFYPKNTNVKHI